MAAVLQYSIVEIKKLETAFVLDFNVVETVNQATVIPKIDDILEKLHVQIKNFNLLLSDAVRYMTSSRALLKILYPQLFMSSVQTTVQYVHLLQNCDEKVRSHFLEGDSFIATV